MARSEGSAAPRDRTKNPERDRVSSREVAEAAEHDAIATQRTQSASKKSASSLRVRSSLTIEEQAVLEERFLRRGRATAALEQAVGDVRALGGETTAWELRRLASDEFRRVDDPEFSVTAFDERLGRQRAHEKTWLTGAARRGAAVVMLDGDVQNAPTPPPSSAPSKGRRLGRRLLVGGGSVGSVGRSSDPRSGRASSTTCKRT